MKTAQKAKHLHCAILIIAAFFLCLFSAFFTLGNNSARAEEKAGYQTAYIGNVIDAGEYTLSVDGKNVKAEGLTAVYPSGGVFGGEKFIIEQAGKYEVTYYATVDGALVEETQRYMAIRKPQDIIVASEGMNVGFGKYQVESPYTIKKNVCGAIVTFRAGESVAFATNIKTEKLTANYNILDLIVMPSVFKETDFERLTVRVADAENPDNFVEIIIKSSNAVDGGGQVSYVTAAANGQQSGGYEGGDFNTDAPYGTQVEHSFRGLGYNPVVPQKAPQDDPRSYPENHTISEHSVNISIDHAEKKVYCGPSSFENSDKSLVNDLDDPGIYKGNPWGGFTSDEVVVTLSAGFFSKAEGKVLIKSFGDFDCSKNITDELAPEIFVDCESAEEMPNAVVGENFPVFPFVAKDALDQQVKTDVWVYYKDANGQKITVANDGDSFFVKYAGTYEIVYRAEDYSGNVAQKSVTINAVDHKPSIFIAIESATIEASLYQTVKIAEASQMQVFGGSGTLRVERTVYAPDGQVLDVSNKLQLLMLGDYKVVYTVTDYLGSVEYGVVTIRSNGLEAPKFVEEPHFDDRLLVGFTYNLPKVLVVETVNGEIVELACETYVNGAPANGSFEVKGGQEQVEILYLAKGATGEAQWTKSLSVVDTEDGKYKSKYFYNDEGRTDKELRIVDEKSYVEFVFTKDFSAGFINALYAREFSLTMSYLEDKVGFTAMTIKLTDAVSASLSVTLRLLYDSNEKAWFLQANGDGKKYAFSNSKDVLTLILAGNGDKVVDVSGVNVATILVWDNGEAFSGFAEMLYMEVAFEGIEEDILIQSESEEDILAEMREKGSIFRITQISNQSMGYTKSTIDKAQDEIKPIIVLDEDLQLRQDLGAKANIPTARAYDVLSQISKFTVTVDFNGEVVAEGSAMERLNFTLDKAGYYTVTYYARDTNGNFERIPYVLFVRDETAPTLTVKNNLKATYKVGDKIKIPSYTVKDNDGVYYAQVTLIMPNNEMRLLQYNENGEITSYLDKENDLYYNDFKAGSNTFVALEKGRYVLRIVAYDEYYNYTVQEIVFNVK